MKTANQKQTTKGNYFLDIPADKFNYVLDHCVKLGIKPPKDELLHRGLLTMPAISATVLLITHTEEALRNMEIRVFYSHHRFREKTGSFWVSVKDDEVLVNVRLIRMAPALANEPVLAFASSFRLCDCAYV